MDNALGRLLRAASYLRRYSTFTLLALSLTLTSCAKVSGSLKKIGQSLLTSAFTVKLTTKTVTITEGSAATMAVTLDQTRTTDTVLTLTYPNGTGTTDADFVMPPTSVTIPAGSLIQTVFVSATDDSIYEGTEVHNIVIGSNSAEVVVEDSNFIVTINDNEVAPEIDFALNSQNVNENVGTGSATLTIDRASSNQIAVAYSVSAGTATGSGTDYTLSSGTATFSAGATSTSISFAINDDSSVEPTENFTITLGTITGDATLGAADDHAVSIIDNDYPSLIVSDVSGTEGSSLTFTVTASNTSTSNITFNYASANGTALSGTNYTAVSSSGTITAGQTTTTIVVNTTNTAGLCEGDRTFDLTISSPANATIGDATGVGTIQDDDVPSLSIANASATEGSSLTVVATLSAACPSGNVTFNWSNSSSTATAGTDFTTITSQAVTIAAGVTTANLVTVTTQDTLDEVDETFNVSVASPVNATISTGTATGTITDDDAAPSIQFVATSQTVAESVGTVTVASELSAVSGKEVTAPFTISGTATASGTDHNLASGTVTIAAGSSTANTTFTVTNDTLYEATETVILTQGVPVNASSGTNTTHTVSITDNDTAPALSINDVSLAENGGSATFTVTMSAASGTAMTVDYATAAGSAPAATSGTDFTATTGTLTIAAGSTTGTIAVPLLDDAVYEGSENYVLNLSNATGASISDSQGAGTITEDDAAPTIQFSATTQARNEAIGTVTVTTELSAASAINTTVTYAVTGTATGSGTDHNLAGATITITAGQTTANTTFTVTDDAAAESSETVILTLSSPSGATLGTNTTHTVTILDNDSTINMTVADASATEGSTITFTVSLDNAPPSNVTVNYATSDGTATTAGSDYTSATGTLTITAGSTTGTITVSTGSDTNTEGSDTFTLTLSSPAGANLSDATAIGTITNDDITGNVWTGAVNNDFSNNGNWQDGSAPGGGTTAYLVPGACTGSACNVTIDGAISIGALLIGDGFTGTVTIGTGNSLTTSTWFTQDGGVFNGNGQTMSVGTFTLTKNANFTAPATLRTEGNLYVVNSPTTSWTGSNVVVSSPASGAGAPTAISVGTATLNNVSFEKNTSNNPQTITVTGTLTVSGNLSIDRNGVQRQSITGGTINLGGDLSIVDSDSDAGTTVIRLVGTGAQTVTGTSGATIPSLEIAKPSGTATLSGTIDIIRNLTYTSGTVDAGTSTVRFVNSSSGGGASTTVNMGAIPLNHVAFAKDTANNPQTITVTGTLTTLGNATVARTGAQASSITGGTVDVNGNLTISSSDSDSGTALFRLVGTGSQTVTGTSGASIPSLEFAKPSGTATLSGTIDLIRNLTYTSGTVDPGTSTVRFVNNAAGGGASSTVNMGTVALNNVSLSKNASNNSQTINVTGTLTALGNLVATTTGGTNMATNGGTIAVAGNVSVTAANGGTTAILLNGTGSQTVTHSGGVPPGGTWTINKSSGTVTLATALTLNTSGQDLTLTSGTLDMAGFALTVSNSSGVDNVLTLASGTTIYTGCGTITAETTTNSGTIVAGSLTQLSINDPAAVTEGTNSVFTVSLDALNCANVVFNYATASGTATSGSDFTSTSGTATITAGQSSTTVTVPTTNDALYEGATSETFNLDLTSITNTAVTDNSGVGSIDDNEAQPTVEWSAASSSVGEGDGSATITLQLNRLSYQNVVVPFTLSGTATGGGGSNDYTNPTTPVTITAGQSTTTVATSIYDDIASDGNETIIFTVGTPTNATAGTQTTHTLTITDNDAPTVEFASASQNFNEVNGFSGDSWASGMSSWTRRMKIRFKNSTASNLTNFPVLVVLNSSRVTYADFNSNGDDIRFIDSDGTSTLKHEIESWNTSGTSYIWVKIPQIDAGSLSDYMYMYYKNSGASSGQDAANVWESNFGAIYHMADANDRSSNAKHGTNTGASFTTGAFGDGASIGGGTNRITLPDSMSVGATQTISAWFKTSSYGVIYGQQAAAYSTTTTPYYPPLYVGSDYKLRGGYWREAPSSQPGFVSSSNVNDDVWHHAVITNDTTTGQKLYLDGVLLGTGTVAQSNYNTAIKNQIGLGYGTSWTGLSGWVSFTGTLDELRISNNIRSADWIQSEYLTGADSFLIYETVQTPTTGQATVTVNLSPAAGSAATVDYAITGTASNPADHNLGGGTLTFTTGQTTASLSPTILVDAASEGNETIIVTLSNPTVATLGTATTHTITIVDYVNVAPVANNDSAVVSPDASNSIAVTANDTDANSDALLVSSITQGTYGSVSASGANVIYTPTTGFTGTDSFTYTITDGIATASATVNVTVRSGFNWTGGGVNSNFNNAANWYGNVAPTSTDNVYFADAFCSSTCNATININSPVKGLSLAPGYSGTITQSGAFTLSIGTTGYIQKAGTFSGGTGAITTSSFKLTGGTFTSTSGSLTVTGTYEASGGTFTPNSGTVVFSGSGASLTAGSFTYNNFNVSPGAANSSLLDTLTVSGTLTFGGGWHLNDGTIRARGNISVSNFNGGTTLVLVDGSGTQTITGANTEYLPSLEIASTGTVNLSGTVGVAGNFTYTSGSVSPGAATMFFDNTGYTISANGLSLSNVIVDTGASTTTLSGTLITTGTLTLQGGYGLTGGTILARGDISVSNFNGGSTSIIVDGSGTQTITGVNTEYLPNFEIASSGTVAFAGTVGVGRNFTYTSGTLSMGTSTIRFNNSGYTINAGGQDLGSVWFSHGNPSVTLTGTLISSGTLSLDSAYALNGGTIRARGNVSVTNGSSAPGTTALILDGSGTQTLTGTAGESLVSTEFASTGTINLAGTIRLARAFTYSSGTVNPGTSTVEVVSSGYTVNSGAMSWNNMSIVPGNPSVTFSGTINVAGNVTMNTAYQINGGTLAIGGNLTVTNTSTTSTTNILLNGTGTQTISQTSAEMIPGTSVIINKASGTVELATALTLNRAAQSLTLTSGTLNMNNYNMTVSNSSGVDNVLTLDPGTTINRGTGSITAETTVNNGTIN